MCIYFSGSGGISAGREERPGEHETGPGETNQNAGICPQAREVSPCARCPARPLWYCFAQVQSVTTPARRSFCRRECKNPPPCGHSWLCRAKHQKLKTGNDQSPGDKKPEMEMEQRMFSQTRLLLISLHNITDRSVCLIQFPTDLLNPTLSQPIRCLGRRDASCYASKAFLLAVHHVHEPAGTLKCTLIESVGLK